MDDRENKKEQSLEEISQDLDAKIEKYEEMLAKSEANLKKTQEKIKRLKQEISNFKKQKSALFGDKMMQAGIASFQELSDLIALHREKNPTHEHDNREGVMM